MYVHSLKDPLENFILFSELRSEFVQRPCVNRFVIFHLSNLRKQVKRNLFWSYYSSISTPGLIVCAMARHFCSVQVDRGSGLSIVVSIVRVFRFRTVLIGSASLSLFSSAAVLSPVATVKDSPFLLLVPLFVFLFLV